MKQSAGLLVFTRRSSGLEVLLVHPGGPFFSRKDEGSWSIPKGEYKDENPLEVAIKEFAEETGNVIEGTSSFIQLADVRLKSGKVINAWAVEHDLERCFISSNTYDLEWPPKSGRIQTFPEVDRAEWFSPEEAVKKLNPAQIGFVEQLVSLLS